MGIRNLNQGSVSAEASIPFYDAANGVDRRASLREIAEIVAALIAENGGGGTTPVAPTITTQPSNATAAEGATATFTVVAAGDAPLTYQWSRDGVAIGGATSASYTTPTLALSDDGAAYTVTVTNDAGSVTSSAASLTVSAGAVAPSITVQPSSQSVTAPATATFNVTATGTAPLAYQWRKGGVNISGATSASYTTPATTTGDTGSVYSVVVSNGVNSVTSSNATLTVNAAATVPAAPTIGTATAGNASVTVAFTPNGNGGSAILDYTVTLSPGGLTATGSASPITVTGATNGTAYTATVTARNAVGPSSPSAASNSVTPAAPADTRPRYWYGPATDYQSANIAAAFAGATPLPGSTNGGKTSTAGAWTPSPSGTQYIWIAVLQSAGDITVTDPLGQDGFNGAELPGDFEGVEVSPSHSTTPYVHSSGTYLLYRSNYRGMAGTPLTLV